MSALPKYHTADYRRHTEFADATKEGKAAFDQQSRASARTAGRWRATLSAALVPALQISLAAEHRAKNDAERRVRVTLDRRRPSVYEINARGRAA